MRPARATVARCYYFVCYNLDALSLLKSYRNARNLSQADLARALGVTQAYVSQVEAGRRPVTRKLAERLGALPDLPPAVLPPALAELDGQDADLAADLGALGYPPFAGGRPRRARNPAAVVLAIISPRQVAPNVMNAVPWVLLTFPGIDAAWLTDQARRRNLQNRLGFLTDLAIELARARVARAGEAERDAASDALAALEALRAELEESRLANAGTLARVLGPAERQFFEEHRGAAARHWNLHTGLTAAQLPYR